MVKAFYSDSKRNIEFVKMLFQANNMPNYAKETNKVLFLAPIMIAIFVFIGHFGDNIQYLALAMLVLYIFSFFTHLLWWSRLRSDIDSEIYRPVDGGEDTTVILKRREVIRNFMGRFRIYRKEAIVAFAFLVINIVLELRRLEKANFNDVYAYFAIFTVIFTNEMVIFLWRKERESQFREIELNNKSQIKLNNGSEFGGLYFVLKGIPIWVMSIIMLVGGPSLFFAGRWYFEGVPYEISSAAAIGDYGIMTCILIGVTVLQRESPKLPEWIVRGRHQIWLAILCVIVGCIFLSLKILGDKSSGQVADLYHDVIVVPFFLFFLLLLAPVVWSRGAKREKFASVAMIFIWLIFVYTDYRNGMLDQRVWLQKRGLTFEN